MKFLSDFEYKGREIIICENSDYVPIDVATFYCAYVECEKSLADKAYNPFFPAWITYRGKKFNEDQYFIGFDTERGEEDFQEVIQLAKAFVDKLNELEKEINDEKHSGGKDCKKC